MPIRQSGSIIVKVSLVGDEIAENGGSSGGISK